MKKKKSFGCLFKFSAREHRLDGELSSISSMFQQHCFPSSSSRLPTPPQSCSGRTRILSPRRNSRIIIIVQAQEESGVRMKMPRRASAPSPTMPLSTSSSSSSTSSASSLLATAAAAAAAAVLLCSSLFASPAHAADFVAPGSIVAVAEKAATTTTNPPPPQLQAPPSRARGIARSKSASSPSPSPPPSIELLSGSVRVSDGDTVEITSAADGTKHKIRIWGIDAPETKQLCRDPQGKDYECGRKATERMKELLGGTATCEVKQRDQYGRAVARCYRGIKTERELENEDGDNRNNKSKNLDAGLALVESGDAVAYRQFSKGFYEPAEKIAKEKKIGIWSGEFEVRKEEKKFFVFSFFFLELRTKQNSSLLSFPKNKNNTKRADPGGLAARPEDQDPAERRGAARAEPRRGRGARPGAEACAAALSLSVSFFSFSFSFSFFSFSFSFFSRFSLHQK